MKSLIGIAGTAASVVVLLGTAPVALASGGRVAPTGGGGGTTLKAPTGGGGGGGGGGGVGGGVNDVVVPVPAPPLPPPPPPPPAPACATFTSVSAPVGYYITTAAVWNDFTIWNCSSSAQNYTVRVTDTDATGLVGYDVSVIYAVGAGQQINGVLDNDFAPFNTTYAVTMTVSDASGATLDSRTTTATTPPPR